MIPYYLLTFTCQFPALAILKTTYTTYTRDSRNATMKERKSERNPVGNLWCAAIQNCNSSKKTK